ncbi:MAG: hypothetical protein KGQ37_03150 [Hyphomicrobiales bacterium]|nr:hypothetical protein [Hyphomicrobiales bacterium]
MSGILRCPGAEGALHPALGLRGDTEQGTQIIASITATFLITGTVTLIVTRGRHRAWPLFLAITVLALAPLW